jgi:hypothetical protein
VKLFQQDTDIPDIGIYAQIRLVRGCFRAGNHYDCDKFVLTLQLPMLKAAHQRKFDIIIVFWALDQLTREGTRATLNYLQRLESKGVG